MEDDVIIHVARTIRPGKRNDEIRSERPDWRYPAWTSRVLHQELETSGPEQYSLSALRELKLSHEELGRRDAPSIINYLEAYRLIQGCLGLRDFEEMAKVPRTVLVSQFRGKTLLGWRSAILGRLGLVNVPCLVLKEDPVVFRWEPMGENKLLGSAYATYRFPVH